MNNLLCLSFLSFITLVVFADDYRWVKGTFSWKGNGTLTTQIIPLYGETFRVAYASPQKGPLRITVVDAAARKRKAPREIVKTKQLVQAGSKSLDGLQVAMLVIEGDGRPWEVRIDKCLTSVQEWKLRNFLKEQKASGEKLGVWAGTGSEEFSFEAQGPWKIRLVQEGEGVVALTATSSQGALCYKTQLLSDGQVGEGWIPAAGLVDISVSASDTDWLVEAIGN